LPWPKLGSGLMGLGPRHALAYACLNRALDMQIGEPDRLKLLYDIHLLVERMDADAWRQFLLLVASKQIGGICLRSIGDAGAAFGSAVPADVLEALRRGAEEGPIDWRRLDDWRHMQWPNSKSLPGKWGKVSGGGVCWEAAGHYSLGWRRCPAAVSAAIWVQPDWRRVPEVIRSTNRAAEPPDPAGNT